MVNWSIKLGLVGLTTIATTLAIVGCDVNEVNEVEAKSESNIEIYKEINVAGDKWDFASFEIIDKETGVHYLVARCINGVSVTPMYNADGSLKIN